MKADFVYAVILKEAKMTQLLFERRDNGMWTLAGGEVGPDETEEDALLRHLREQWHPASEVIVDEQLGPLHHQLDGRTAKAFMCYVEEPTKDVGPPFAQCAFVNREDVRTSVPLESRSIERMIWDGFSMLEAPEEVPNEHETGVTGVFCEPGKEHLLREECGTHALVWRRLDPSQQDGFMKPMS